MSPINRKRGFATFSEVEKYLIARKAGRTKNPNKGFGSLTKKEAVANGKRAINKRWELYRSRKEVERMVEDSEDLGVIEHT